MPVHCRVTTSIKFAGTHLHTYCCAECMSGERSTGRETFLLNTTELPGPGLESKTLDPEASSLTTAPPTSETVYSPCSETCALQAALCTTRSHGTKLHILVSKLHNGTSKTMRPAFVLEVSLRNFLTSIFNFVPCDRVMQRRAY